MLIFVTFSLNYAKATLIFVPNEKKVLKDTFQTDTFYFDFAIVSTTSYEDLETLALLKFDSFTKDYNNYVKSCGSPNQIKKYEEDILRRKHDLIEMEALLKQINLFEEIINHQIFELNIGHAGKISSQQKRFLNLVRQFTEEDLIQMVNHPQPVIKLYGLQGLVNIEYSELQSIVNGLSKDNSPIKYFIGCVEGVDTVKLLSERITSFAIKRLKRLRERD